MSDARPQGGFGYWVSDDQLQAYALLTPLQRLQWLDEARRFIMLALPLESRERQERLRRGLTITGDWIREFRFPGDEISKFLRPRC